MQAFQALCKLSCRGCRVILTQRGCILVRPNCLELQLQVRCKGMQCPGTQQLARMLRVSLMQDSRQLAVHRLNAYQTAMLDALRTQFTRRGLPGGRRGVLAMLQGSQALQEVLAADGCAALWAGFARKAERLSGLDNDLCLACRVDWQEVCKVGDAGSRRAALCQSEAGQQEQGSLQSQKP